MAIANGREACEKRLLEAGADVGETMKGYAQEQLRVNTAMERKLMKQEEERRKAEAASKGRTEKLRPSHPTPSDGEPQPADGASDEQVRMFRREFGGKFEARF